MTEIALASPESLASPQLRRGSWRACLGAPPSGVWRGRGSYLQDLTQRDPP